MESISLKAQELFGLGGFTVTNSLILTLTVSVLLIFLGFLIHRKISLVPGKIQSLVEIGITKLLDLMTLILGDKERAERYFPLIATLFVFIMTCNLLGVLPGVGSLIFHHNGEGVPLFRSPAADLNFTLAFAVLSVFLTNLFGIITVGFFAHAKKFINFGSPIKFFVGILETLSEIARIISFSFRLFGNIFAGEVLLAIVFSLMPYVVPVPFITLEMFFGTIQAFVFAILTLVILALHTAEVEH
jgi:F-type H+-transporting ATPase subunit a